MGVLRVEVVLVGDDGEFGVVATEGQGGSVEDTAASEHGIGQAEVLGQRRRPWGCWWTRRAGLVPGHGR